MLNQGENWCGFVQTDGRSDGQIDGMTHKHIIIIIDVCTIAALMSTAKSLLQTSLATGYLHSQSSTLTASTSPFSSLSIMHTSLVDYGTTGNLKACSL